MGLFTTKVAGIEFPKQLVRAIEGQPLVLPDEVVARCATALGTARNTPPTMTMLSKRLDALGASLDDLSQAERNEVILAAVEDASFARGKVLTAWSRLLNVRVPQELPVFTALQLGHVEHIRLTAKLLEHSNMVFRIRVTSGADSREGRKAIAQETTMIDEHDKQSLPWLIRLCYLFEVQYPHLWVDYERILESVSADVDRSDWGLDRQNAKRFLNDLGFDPSRI